MLLEQVLELGEPGEAEGLGEADQGRGLDPCLGGDLADRAERHLAGMLPEEDRHLPEALGEMDGARGKDGAELLVGAGPGVAERGTAAIALALRRRRMAALRGSRHRQPSTIAVCRMDPTVARGGL